MMIPIQDLIEAEQLPQLQHELDRLLSDLMNHTSNASRLKATARPYSMDGKKAKIEWAKAFATKHNIFKMLMIPDPNPYYKD